MPFCVKCGKELSYSDKFCSACGKENAEYRPDSGPKTGEYDITITPKIRLYGPQDAKTEIELYIPQLRRTMYLRFPNFFELGQTLRVHGEGLTKPNGEKGDLLVTPTEVEYYDTELTISARLVGAADAVTKIPLYLPHAGKTVQISVPNNMAVDKTLRLKGLGLGTPNGENGDLYLHFNHIEYVQDDAVPHQEGKNEEAPKRKTEYVGELKKCPSCGDDVPSFTAICPTCGHEFSAVKKSASVVKFTAEIDACDKIIATQKPAARKGWSIWKNWKTWQKVGWIILNIYLNCIPVLVYFLWPYIRSYTSRSLSVEEKRKATIIENYTFPNDRGSILEALWFAKAKVSFLANEKVNANNDYWMRLWVKQAEQLHQKAEMLFQGDRFANDAYEEIIKDHSRFKKRVRIRIVGILGVFLVAVLLLFVRSCAAFGSGNGVYRNDDGTYSNIPTISEDIGTNETNGIYSYQIRNYVGKNVASIGKKSGSYIVDEYGSGDIRIILYTENGILIDPEDEEMKKEYSVVGQNLPAGSELIVVHQRDSGGEPYDTLVSYQSHEEIVLFVAPVGKTDFDPTFSVILPTLDRHEYHIRDYVGRNAASFGITSGSEIVDEYGVADLRISFTSTDGSFVDINDMNKLKAYVVIDQDIKPNTKLEIRYDTDSSGQEYDSLIQYQNYEEINLTVELVAVRLLHDFFK